MICKVCMGNLTPLLTLPDMPSVAQYLPDYQKLSEDRGITLDINQCIGCDLVQLTNKPVSYWRESIRYQLSSEMGDFRVEQLDKLRKDFGLKSVVEIGRNPVASTVPYDGFLLLDSLEHVPDPNFLLDTAHKSIREGGVGIVEVPNFDMILKKNLISEFMLDHLFYFTAQTLRRTLELNGFNVLEIKPVWKDYVLSALVRKRKKLDLSNLSLDETKIKGFIKEGKTAIWGAGHQALAVMSLLKLDPVQIKYVVDDSPLKQGRYTPVTHIPIVPPKALVTDPVEALLVICGSYSEEVLKKAQEYKVEVMVL